jgi:hypothetical protein
MRNCDESFFLLFLVLSIAKNLRVHYVDKQITRKIKMPKSKRKEMMGVAGVF